MRLRSALSLALGWAGLVAAGDARAQTHWDAAVEVGAMTRFATGRDAGAPAPEPGPVGELNGHVAVFPMLRVGAYVGHDISPLSAQPARQITEGGLHLKFAPPLLPLPWRTWAYLGAGYARVYQPSHAFEAGQGSVVVPGQGGGMLELRLGVAAGVRLSRAWDAFAELGGRAAPLFSGALFDRGSCGCGAPFGGKDSFALSLSLGLSLNQ